MMSTIEIKIRFFAALRESLGEEQRSFNFKNGISCEELLAELKSVFTGATSLLDASRLAVNGYFASKGLRLSQGDEVQILPPVSGG